MNSRKLWKNCNVKFLIAKVMQHWGETLRSSFGNRWPKKKSDLNHKSPKVLTRITGRLVLSTSTRSATFVLSPDALWERNSGCREKPKVHAGRLFTFFFRGSFLGIFFLPRSFTWDTLQREYNFNRCIAAGRPTRTFAAFSQNWPRNRRAQLYTTISASLFFKLRVDTKSFRFNFLNRFTFYYLPFQLYNYDIMDSVVTKCTIGQTIFALLSVL